MCLALVAFDVVPGWAVILAANRDEYRDRPARAMDWWSDRPEIVGGRDLRSGGTWLAARRDGRFAAVLNDARIPAPAAAPSRGTLVTDILEGDDMARRVTEVQARSDRYAGFHLLAGEPASGWYCGNRDGSSRSLAAGVHAVGNAGLDPNDPRVQRGRSLFEATLSAPVSTPALLECLADREEVPPGEGDCRPVFIAARAFGTRCSSVLLVAHDGTACFHERRFDAGSRASGETLWHWSTVAADERAGT